MKINQEKISLISTGVNFVLAGSKLVTGFLIKSLALIADGLHSTLDIFSSFVAFLGIKISRKPVDEKHPYGFYRVESLSGLLIALLLFFSAIWIVWEGIKNFFEESFVVFSFWGIVVIGVSVLVNEVMARLKFHYGRKFKSLSLIADAQHSRADVLSSIAVLGGFVLGRYFPFLDSVLAILIGVYLIKGSFEIGKELTDSLLDVSDKEVEERIKKICLAHKIEIFDMKTRKIGGISFAELKINVSPKLKVDEVSKIIDTLEERLLKNIPQLKYIIISIEPYDIERQIILPQWGTKICSTKGLEKLGPEKLGQRIVVPLEEGEISDNFGAENYLILDVKEKKVLQKEIVKNPYFEKNSPHGARFIKAVSGDKVLTKTIGANARQNLEDFGIEVEIISKNKKLNDILNEYEK